MEATDRPTADGEGTVTTRQARFERLLQDLEASPEAMTRFQTNPLEMLSEAGLPLVLSVEALPLATAPGQPSVVHAAHAERQASPRDSSTGPDLVPLVRWWGVSFYMSEGLTQRVAEGLIDIKDLIKAISAALGSIPGIGTFVKIVAESFAVTMFLKKAQISYADEGAGVHWPVTWFHWFALLAVAPLGVPAVQAAMFFGFHPFSNGVDGVPDLWARRNGGAPTGIGLLSVGNEKVVWGVKPDGGVYQSLDQGATWEPRAMGYTTVSAAADGTVIGCNGYLGVVARWNEETSQFDPIPAQLGAEHGLILGVSAASSESLWCVTNTSNVLRSTDGGLNWKPTNGALHVVSAASDGSVYGVNRLQGILYRWVEASESWEPVATPPGVAVYSTSVAEADEVWILASQPPGYIYRSSGQGSTFESVVGLLSDLSAAADGTVLGLNSSNIYELIEVAPS